MRKWASLAAAALVSLASLASCKGGIHAPQDQSCIGGCGPGTTCVTDFYDTGGQYSVCALAAEPDRRCGHADPETDMQLCDGGHALACEGAYVTNDLDCAADGRVCVAFRSAHGKPTSACALSAAPDAACSVDAPTRRACIANVLVQCIGPYRAHSSACSEGTFCREDGDDAACVLGPDPDPTCVARGGRAYCEGTKGIACLGEWRLDVLGDCANVGKQCVDEGPFVDCR